MTQGDQLSLPLWEALQEATTAPDAANVRQLLSVLETALLDLDTLGQLQVASEAITQIVQVFQARSLLAFETLEAMSSDEGPIMPEDAFDRYVRQTMEVDFDPFIEPLASLPRKVPERPAFADTYGSVVGELDQAALLQALDEQMHQHPGLTEVEAFNQAMEIAHDEDVSAWVGAVAQWIGEQNISGISLLQLQQSVGMPLIQLWLALLLGGFTIEQRGDFYETDQVWIVA